MALGLLATACGSDASSSDADSAAVAAPTASQPDSTTSNDSATAVPTSPDGDVTAATSAPVAVPELLQFTAPLVGGGEFTGADYADKPTVFWFWAPT
jgi:hypothetical protein